MNNKALRASLAISASWSLVLLAVTPAFGQTEKSAAASNSNASEAAPADASGGLGDIVVTARRRSELLQSVPVAVTAFTGEGLRAQNIVSTEDLRQHTPGFQVSPSAFGSNAPSYSIRSQLQLEPTLTLDPSVGVYFAEVVQARAYGTNSSLYDLESVQVLKGPQGTLFGRNTTGGAVVITPKAPTDKFEGYGMLTVGDYGTINGEAAINLPLTDKILFRAAASIARHDGYTYNALQNTDQDDKHTDDFRFSLRLLPTDNLTNTTVLHFFRANEHGTAFRLKEGNPAGPAAFVYGDAFTDIMAQQNSLPFHTVISGAPTYAKIHAWDVSNITTLELSEAFTIKNIFGYRQLNSTNGFDLDGTALPVIDSLNKIDADEISEEFQISGKLMDGNLNYILGAYYLRESGLDEQDTIIFGGPFTYPAIVKNTSKSVFGQVSYQIPGASGLSLTLGGRYTWDDRAFTSRNTSSGACAITDGGVPRTNCAYSDAKSFSKFTYTAGIDYKIDPRHMIYAVTRRGYRAGGYNVRGTETAAVTASGQVINTFGPFNPETATDYEVGTKNEFQFGGMAARLNIAAYHTEYKDIQRTGDIPAVDPATGNQTILTFVTNAAAARINGIEIEAVVLPTRNLDIGASFSVSDAKYKKWIDPVLGDLSANHFALSPKYQFSPHIAWTIPLAGDSGKITARVDAYFQSTTQFTDVNEPGPGSQGPYGISNARLTWSNIMGKELEASLYINNIFDREYYTGGVTIFNALGTTGANLSPPRTFGASLRYGF